jgi:hypothetical protein
LYVVRILLKRLSKDFSVTDVTSVGFLVYSCVNNDSVARCDNGSCEHGNEASGSVKGDEFLD